MGNTIKLKHSSLHNIWEHNIQKGAILFEHNYNEMELPFFEGQNAEEPFPLSGIGVMLIYEPGFILVLLHLTSEMKDMQQGSGFCRPKPRKFIKICAFLNDACSNISMMSMLIGILWGNPVNIN